MLMRHASTHPYSRLSLVVLISMASTSCSPPEPTANTTPEDSNSEGGEEQARAAASDDVEPREPGQGEGGIVGIVGVYTPTPEQRAATDAQRESQRAQRETERAQREAEFQARCEQVTLTPGLPPSPPAMPTNPGLDALRPAYESSVAPAFDAPPGLSMDEVNQWAQSTFADWVRNSIERLQAFSRETGTIPVADRYYARIWAAHAWAVFLERFHAVPIPDEVRADPELRETYLRALTDQSEPILARTQEILDGVTLSGAFTEWKTRMNEWLQQETCALH